MSGDNEKGGAATSAKKFLARQFKISGKSSSKKRRERNQTLDPQNPENHDQPGYNFGDAGEKKRTRAKIRQNGNWIVVKNQFLGPPSEHKTRSLKASKARVWRALVAEFFATALFIFFATGAVVVSLRFDPTGGAVANLIVAFTQAFALSIAIYYSANISGGHINPAVTLSFLLVGRMRFLVAILYWISQIVGAIVGSALLHAIIPDNEEGNLGSTTLAPGYSRGRGVLLEAILTFTLVSTVYATAIDRIGFGKGAPFAIGLSIFIDLIIGWKLTGASMNPARSIGPAIISNTWDAHWVYWVGPIIGAIVGAYIYDFILISRPDNKNPFSAGTRMETEGRPIIAVPAQELAPEDNAADSLSDVNPTNNTQEATDKPDKSPSSAKTPSIKSPSASSAIPEVQAV